MSDRAEFFFFLFAKSLATHLRVSKGPLAAVEAEQVGRVTGQLGRVASQLTWQGDKSSWQGRKSSWQDGQLNLAVLESHLGRVTR